MLPAARRWSLATTTQTAPGVPVNMANWMIEYQDRITFVNRGDEDRTITLHLRKHGTLAILVRNSVTGEVRTPPTPLGCEKRAVYQQLQVSTHRVCTQRNAGDAR